VTFFLPCLPAPSIDGVAGLSGIGLWRPAALRSGPAQEVIHLSFSSSGGLVASGLSKKFGPIHKLRQGEGCPTVLGLKIAETPREAWMLGIEVWPLYSGSICRRPYFCPCSSPLS
jgi:hypothetical protein